MKNILFFTIFLFLEFKYFSCQFEHLNEDLKKIKDKMNILKDSGMADDLTLKDIDEMSKTEKGRKNIEDFKETYEVISELKAYLKDPNVDREKLLKTQEKFAEIQKRRKKNEMNDNEEFNNLTPEKIMKEKEKMDKIDL